MNVLVIGGTRNLGHELVLELLAHGHRVSVLNRGITPDELSSDVERLRADRRDSAQLRSALGTRSWDAVVDLALYNGREAKTTIELLQGRTGHFVFISSGQVYLVREGLARPFREDDYKGAVMADPGGRDHEDWLYGVEKRLAEDALIEAGEKVNFPFTTLRLPMVNGARDHYFRIYNYILRFQDGGLIVAPDAPNLKLRHVYSADVVRAIAQIIEGGKGKRRAFNLSQEETLTLEEFLAMLAEVLSKQVELVRVPRAVLEENGLLPQCSPFSGRWMSELDNERSKRELGVTYTPMREAVKRIVEAYAERPPEVPESYSKRGLELRVPGDARKASR